jgi:glycosyltransferase involved in cell wall biosynthesis
MGTENKIVRNASEKLKICMLSTGHNHLDDRIYYKEALSLLKRGGDIVIIASGEVKRSGEIPDGVEFVSLGQWRSLWSRFSLIPKAVMAVLRVKPDVCHFHDFELIFALPFLRMFSRCRIIYDVHEVYPEMALESVKIPRPLRTVTAKLVGLSERLFARLAHYIITTDDGIAKRFMSFHPRVRTVFNYPRLNLFSPDVEKADELKARYAGRTPIIYCGGMGKSKGLFLMLKAMRIIAERRPDAVLLLAGPIGGNDLEKAQEEIRESGIRDHVEFLGFVPHNEVVNYISASRLGLIANLPTPKWFINVPIKQFEYMACGVPVLGSDLPPVSSYINAAGCGTVFDPFNPESLAAAAIDILSDDAEWKRMSEAGKKAVSECWNWHEMEERLFLVYEELSRI